MRFPLEPARLLYGKKYILSLFQVQSVKKLSNNKYNFGGVVQPDYKSKRYLKHKVQRGRLNKKTVYKKSINGR